MTARRKQARLGFTMVEALVVISIVGIMAMFTAPPLLQVLKRSRLTSAARETTNLMRVARAEAIKRQIPAGVTQDLANRALIAFVDLDRNGVYNEGTDRLLNRHQFPDRVFMNGPGDTLETSFTNASVGFADSGNSAGPGTVMFGGLGSAQAQGAFRFTNGSGQDFLEVRVEPAGTGRVIVQKYLLGAADPDDPDNWLEQGEGGQRWEWGG